MILRTLLVAAAAAALGHAGQTRTWTETEYADFEKGISHNLSLRSDGLITLAPRFQELYDTSSSYLWALARDSKGDLYAGGGPSAKLYRYSAKGDKKMVAELEGLEIHALAVDKSDRLYAATSPDGKIYRMAANGKPELFYDPKAKYIWAMAFDSKGNLFVATGDRGEIHRVAPNGKGGLFFKSDETHVRSLVVDGSDNLIAGTEPGGLVIRISPNGQGFVLYQMSKREVTAVAVAADGAIYAAAVGNKQGVPALPPVAPLPAPAPVAPAGAPGGTTITVRAATPPPPTMSGGAVSVAGGSEVFRIDPSGNPRRVWSNGQDIVYAIAFDGTGHAILGTGNKGYIYRIDSETLYTALLNGSSTQVTDFQSAPGGRLFAVTGNVGKIYEIGPAVDNEGSIESDVFDAGMFARWGRLSFEGRLNGGRIRVDARSGNLDQPQKNWSPWSPPVSSAEGARVTVPPARFVQWRATLTADGLGHSPALESVSLAYLPRNVAPVIEQIEITPPNYKFPPPPVLAPPSQTLNLPPLGKRQQGSRSPSIALETGTPAMQYAKGFIGARWTATDENQDTLVYTAEIRGEKETEWKPLKDKLREKYLSWDSTAFPDGDYRLRVTASDAPSNPAGEALTVTAESDPFTIDNTPPQITGLTAARDGNGLRVQWKAADASSDLKKAEYSLDGGDWTVAPPVGAISDSPRLEYELKLDNVRPGEHTIAVRVDDECDNQGTAKVVVPR